MCIYNFDKSFTVNYLQIYGFVRNVFEVIFHVKLDDLWTRWAPDIIAIYDDNISI